MQQITNDTAIVSKVPHRRKAAALVALALAIAMLLTGTFAWSSMSQRATNPDEGETYPGGRIHDHFDRESGNKDVFAENFGDSDIFVRILLLEFMELNGVIFGEDADRDDPTTWARHIPIPTDPSWNNNAENGAFRDYVTWTMGGRTWYMPTFNQAVDGSRNLETDTTGDAVDWIDSGAGSTEVGAPGQTAAWERWVHDPAHADAITDNTHPMYGYRNTGERNDGTAGFWQQGDAAFEYLWYNPIDPATGERLPPVQSTERVRHDAAHGAQQEFAVRTMQQWIAAGRPTGDFWVIDTSDGWAYWANALPPETATSNLLYSINNIRPAGRWYYAIHVVGEFASAESLSDWDNSEWGEPSEDALDLLRRARGINPVVMGVTIDDGALHTFVRAGETRALNATVHGQHLEAADRLVSWSSAPTGVSATGVVTGTAANVGQTFVVRAESTRDNSHFATVQVHVIPADADGIVTGDGRVFIDHGDNTFREILSPGNLGPVFSAGSDRTPYTPGNYYNVVGPVTLGTGADEHSVRLIGPNADGSFWHPGDDRYLTGNGDDFRIWPNPAWPNFSLTDPNIVEDQWGVRFTSTATSVARGSNLQLAATAVLNGADNSAAITWSLPTSHAGISITSAGLLQTTAASTVNSVVVRATRTGGTEFADITITITAPTPDASNTPEGGFFTDNAGVEWQVLNRLPSGETLIITRRVIGANAPTSPTFAGVVWQAGTNAFGNAFFNGPANQRLGTVWSQIGSDIRSMAVVPNIPTDYRTTHGNWPASNAPEWLGTGTLGAAGTGLTAPTTVAATTGAASAGTGGTGALFNLSLAEAGRYFDRDSGAQPSRQAQSFDGTNRQWWLRSPGTSATSTVALVNTTGLRTLGTATTSNRGVRPALWVNP